MEKLILALLLGNSLWSQGFTIQTIAGTSKVGSETPAQTAALASTEGIAVDRLGNVYISDAPDHRIRKIDSSGQITTVAGNGQPGSTGDGGLAVLAQLNSPYGLAIDLLGNLYVADLGNARIRKISAAGIMTTVAGGGTADVSLFGAPIKATDAKLNAPRNVAVDTAGQVYIADFGAHRVYKLSTDGQLTHVAGAAEPGTAADNMTAVTAPLKSPTALALDSAGSLYIADSGNNAIRKLQRGLLSKVTSTAGFKADIKFATITGLAIDPNTGDLYVAEGRDTPIRRLTPASEPFVFAYGARDLAVDGSGSVWLADGPFVRKLSRLGSEILAGTGNYAFGGDGGLATEARLRSPSSVAADQTGNIYVADTANHRIRRIGTDGHIETYAGTGEAGYSGDDGRAIQAKLNAPTGLLLDLSGNLYFSDTGNHAVRRVAKSGMIQTLAGTGTAGSVGDNGSARRAMLSSPQGLTLDGDTSLIIADTGNHRVAKVSLAGWFTVIAGKGTAGNTGDGASARVAAMSRPTDVAYNGQGELFIVDSGNKRIRRIDAQGRMLGFPSEGLVEPVSLAWSSGGFYIVDAATHRVSLISADGARAAVAGTGQGGFSGDEGPAAAAQLNRPMDVATMPNGDLLIADQDNHRVRLLTHPADEPGGLAPGAVSPSGVTAVVSAAGLRALPAVPGGLMTIFGSGLGPAVGVVGRTDVLGRWDTSLDGVEVQFDGLRAPLFYVQDGQINLQVPRMVTGRARVSMTVLVNGNVRATRTVEVAEAAPALFLGKDNQIAALNQDGGINLPTNPAARGSIVTFFATGSGLWAVDLADGVPALDPLPQPRLPVTVWIGGQVAELLYAGAAPGQVGLIQINVRLPTGAPAGQAAVVLQLGDAASDVGPRISLY